MSYTSQEIRILRFLQESVFGIHSPISDIRFVFNNCNSFFVLDADKAVNELNQCYPLIFDKDSYRPELSSSDKTDIHIVLHDQRTRMNNNLGFSIKSQLGGDSTLLNASGATNFTYRVVGADFSDEEIEKINAIATRTKIIDRVDAIRRKGADLQFDHVDNSTFRSNLAMLDNGLAPTIAQLLVEQFNTGERNFVGLIKPLAESNPLGFDMEDKEDMYIYKLKHLLTSAALGMMPSKKWTGRYDANGGYLVVKRDGEILCYHFYDKNRFEDFLFANAYLERGKTRKHGYASLYRGEDGNVYFKLNLQIRLK